MTALQNIDRMFMFGVDNIASASSTIRSEKVIVSELVNKFPEFYGTVNFPTVLTRVRQCAIS